MPTKVLDIDMDNIPEIISGLNGYPRAMVLVRIHGRPVERIYVPVDKGHLEGGTLRSAILKNAGWVFWEFWLRKMVSLPADEDKVEPPPKATIAICTRDRPADLDRCLDALTRIHDARQEILVVDSCSSMPDTLKVVQKYPMVRYIREEKPGLNRARNRAVKEASNEIIAFIDDDAVPDPNWLAALSSNFHHVNVGCVTGLTLPIELETAAQEYFEEFSTFSRGFNRITHRWSTTHPVGAGKVGVGTNMAIRRSTLLNAGFFDEALDAGTPTFSGGETEMFSRILSTGYQIIYEPRALNWHRHRRSWKELRQAMYGYGVGVYAFWTRKLFQEKEWGVVIVALTWFITGQVPMLFRSLLHLKGAHPPDLILLELLGCLAGPWRYLRSRRQQSPQTGNP